MVRARGHGWFLSLPLSQAALGLSYSGHSADWFFVGLILLAAVAWVSRIQPRVTPRLAARLVLGALLALVVLVLLRSVNNAFFDPIVEKNRAHQFLYERSADFPKCYIRSEQTTGLRSFSFGIAAV